MNNLIKFLVSFMFLFFYMFSANAENAYMKINYGITGSDMGFVSGSGAPTSDEDDEGFMISFGQLIGSNWGVDLMYYDLGTSSVKGDVSDQFTINNRKFLFQTAGTISHDISGYGIGFIGSTDSNGFGMYAKVGLHTWDRSGSTTLLYNNVAINDVFYNEGTDLYGGVGLNIKILDSLSANLALDALSFADEGVSTSNMSTLASFGLQANF